MFRQGADLILWLQANAAFLIPLMKALTHMGEEWFYILFIPFLYWNLYPAAGVRLLVLLTASSFVNAVLKWTFHSPRPYWWDPAVEGMRHEGGFGPPSGHSQNAVAVWGYLAAVIHRLRPAAWVWPAFLLLAFGISVSRMFLGVHFPHSLLLGWMIGAAILIAFLKYSSAVEEWFGRQTTGRQIAWALGTSALMLLIALVMYEYVTSRNLQKIWWENAALDFPDRDIDPITPKYLINFSAIIAAIGVSTALVQRTGMFDPGGSWLLRILRYVLGVAGIIGIQTLFKIATPEEPATLALTLRYLRYFSMIFWALWIWPLICMRINLMRPA